MTSTFANLRQQIAASKWKQLGLVLTLQAVLMLVGFNKIITSPNEKIFLDEWDGIKNYYTFAWYVEQPDTVPYLLFTGMNYPYNEYIYYTDNTPILAVAVRWIHLNVADLSGHTLAAYHWAMFLSTWLSSIVLFFILRRLNIPVLWTILCSVCLVWLHPQILRYSFGTYNLGFSWTLLLVFYGLLRLYEPLQAGKAKAVLGWSLVTAGVIIVSSFCHLYFLAMLLLWVAIYLGVMMVAQLAQRRVPWLAMASGIIMAALSIAACYGTILLTDGYYDYRLTDNAGYGEQSWLLHFKDLFAPYHYNRLQFIFNVEYSGALESHSYLGTGALYGVLMLLVWGIWQSVKNKSWPRFAQCPLALFWASIGLGSLAMMFIAMGETITTSHNNFVTNYLNLFYYLRFVTDKVTQFRGLGRFVWPLFWVFNIGLLYVLAHKRSRIPAIIPFVVLALMLVDTADAVKYYNGFYRDNSFAPAKLQQARETYTAVEPSRYQAIIPIPFYHVGSENYGITMDHYKDMNRQSMRFSLAWKLPLMACQMSRTAEYQALNLTALFQGRGISKEMLALMDNRPVLVMERIPYANHCETEGKVPEGWELNLCEMPLIQTTADYHVYEWWPHGKP